MKRLSQIAIEQRVGVSWIIDYCNKLGFSCLTQNSKIDLQLESQIINLLIGSGEVDHPSKKKEILVSSTSELPYDFSLINPFEQEQLEIITGGDLFSNRPKKTLTFEKEELETVFSDFEAYSICMGLDNKHARHIARTYFKLNKHIENEQFEAHGIAMSALKKYGGETLSFIISLPPLPFKAVNPTQIFSELDKRRKKQEFPILRISFKNANNQIEKIQISFYAEQSDGMRKRNDNVLTIKNNTTGRQIMRVNRTGFVIPENNAKQIIPVIQLFVRFSLDTKQTLVNYGLETGECSICGRELKDSESIKIGIGPVCRKNF